MLAGFSPLRASKPPEAVNDIPAPFNIQAVVLNKAVTLTWQWQPPERRPFFTHFGYEILRNDGVAAEAPATTYSDFDLAFGTYSYRVRARGRARAGGRRILHVSDWSEPAAAVIAVACGGPPAISLAVRSTQRSYSDIPSIRLHLSGSVRLPEGCSLTRLAYHIETDTGLRRSGPMKTDVGGRFDDQVDALGPEDEMPSGGARFTVTAIAEDEAGPVTSDAYTIQMELRNRYAPR